ncbi:MAG: hypothetical protein M3151_03775 [Actinomycetota bacterium]|nr:hypothetical protein [Actinomycetota bacterium]
MRAFRAAWVVVAVVVLGLDAASIPYAYARYKAVCLRDAQVCQDEGILTPEGARALQELGISREFYAAHDVALPTVVALVFFVVAVVIFLRRSDDPMALFGSFTLLVFGGAAAAGTMQELAEARPAFWFPTNLLDYIGQVCFGVFFYLFPDGRFVPRWTRWLAVVVALLFVPNIFFPGSGLDLLDGPLFIVFIGTLVFAQVYRYRRVSTQAQRQQTKWVIFGFATAMVGFSAILVLYSLVPAIAQSTGPLGEMLAETLIYGFILLVPLSIGVAILRSRLYDIDLLINRTLVYGVLTASLALVYFGSVATLQYAFRILAGEDSQLVAVASTLAIAALFGPLRRRIQTVIDRRFYRRKYDAARTLESFSARLRDATELGVLQEDLLEVVGETVQPAYVGLWIRSPSKVGGEKVG